MLGTLAAMGCEPVTAPAFPVDAPPTAFRLSYGGFGYGSHTVTLRGDTLVVVRRTFVGTDSARAAVVPTPAQWGAFWRAADEAGVRAWRRECRNADIVDGGGFTLDLAYDGGHVTSTGSNAYPRRDGTCSTYPDLSAEVRAFFVAVSTLIGRPFP